MSTSYSRRKFLRTTGLAATALLADQSVSTTLVTAAAPEVTLVLRGGRGFIAGKWRVRDIGITARKRLIISSRPLTAERMVNIKGKIIAPGFIDILADNSSHPEQTFSICEKYKLGDGVTTALQMHGGATDAGAFYNHFAQEQHYVNYGVSTKIMNIRFKYGNLADRKRALERSLDSGSLGVSHSLEYQPNTAWEELLAYGLIAKKYDRPVFLHCRYSSSEKELAGVDEAIRLAAVSGCRVHIDHLNSTGGTFHMEAALERIGRARRQSLEITTCVYPFSYWATYLHSKRFDGDWQQRYGMTYKDLEVIGSGERLTKDSFTRYRKKPGVLVAARPGVQPLASTVKPALLEDFCAIGSDGGIEKEPAANNHPRGASCFATAIRYALDEGIPLHRILDKMTTLSARIIGKPMRERGELRDGAIADLTVFDPNAIQGRASNANPCQFSDGIDMVIVGGKIALDRQKLTEEKNGVAIKYPVRVNLKT